MGLGLEGEAGVREEVVVVVVSGGGRDEGMRRYVRQVGEDEETKDVSFSYKLRIGFFYACPSLHPIHTIR